ncbi:MAG: peptidyl-prolyl cis-trans isomerase, partial [Acidobacteriota bacterium]|nr:peptidyl-prolyl cis-trans isomerase [Acidobacteriota bacterium]
MMTTLRDLSPLAVFLLLGAAVFALDRWVVTDTTEGHVIRVTEEQIAGVQERWVAQWGRPPTPQELEGLLDDTVREEILYREAQRLGL